MHYGMMVVNLGPTTDSANIVLTHTTWLMETSVQILQQRLGLNLDYGKLFRIRIRKIAALVKYIAG